MGGDIIINCIVRAWYRSATDVYWVTLIDVFDTRIRRFLVVDCFFLILCKSVLKLRHAMHTSDCTFTVETAWCYRVIPRLTKIIRSGITFVSRNLR